MFCEDIILVIVQENYNSLMHKITAYPKLTIYLVLILNIFLSDIYSQNQTPWTSPLQNCWEYKNDLMTTLKLASDNRNTIFLQNTIGDLFAINTRSGTITWKLEYGGTFNSNVVYANQTLLFLLTKRKETLDISNESFYREVEKDSGITTRSLTISNDSSSYVLKNDQYTYLVSDNGKVLAYDKIDTILWSYDYDSRISTVPELIDNKIVFGTSNKTILSVDTVTGKILKQINLPRTPTSNLVNNKKSYFVGDVLGNVYSIDKGSGRIKWRTKTGGKIISIKMFHEKLLIGSDDNYAYAISIKTGKKIWKRKLAGRVIGQTLLDAFTVAYVSQGTNIAALLSVESGEIVNKIVLDESLYFVSPPIYIDDKVIVATQKGIYAFSSRCK